MTPTGEERRRLEESVVTNPDDASLRFDLGVYLWETEGESKEAAAEHFVISAKLNPQNAAAFKYLGHYYAQFSLDVQRALKCYQRAVVLNPDDSDAGEALCELLDQQGKESLELAVCKDASDKSPRAFWAFRRMGFLQVHQSKWSEAVQSLQHAIRGYPTSADLWEALGLAYCRHGMFTAAIKSYGRAIELDDTRVFALVESGNIHLMIGSFRKGVEQFQQALKISPESVSAHYGLASGLLGLSKECISLGAFKWGSSLLEDACKVAQASTRLSGNLSCSWKLHGDIQITYAQFYPWLEESMSSKCDEKTFSSSILSWKTCCLSAANSARNSYQRAMHLAPWQANIYTDIAITSDLISSLNEDNGYIQTTWQLSEKMALGALLLEGDNSDFWIALGCLSNHQALRQHALIRGLQLDVSLAIAWSNLGKLYREENEKKMARQAFDCARSIDPSLALPWAGMAADADTRESSLGEAFESCLRAAQILPLAAFQIGLAKLALLSGHLLSSQVFGAIQQAVQHAPFNPESHNLNGLVHEARSEYQAAVSSYRLARFAISISSASFSKTHRRDVSINLSRSLCRAGNAIDAVQECENLKKEGMLDMEGVQIYALSLWQLGKHESAISATKALAAGISTMDRTAAGASVSFICRMLYYISGLDSAISSILKMPKELFQSSKISFIVSAIHALDNSNRLESVVSSSRSSLVSHEEITGMHYLITLNKLIKHGSEDHLGFQSAVAHLRKALHMYPNSVLIRNLLGYLLLSSEDWKTSHVSSRCSVIDASNYKKEGLKSAWETIGAGAVACYVVGSREPKFSFPTCSYQFLNGSETIKELQKCFRREPWNRNVQYLLVLNLLQKAREERFPAHLLRVIERLVLLGLSNEVYSGDDTTCQYQKFQLLLCASEICFQRGNIAGCINHVKSASALNLPDSYLFFGYLLLCRAYAVERNFINLLKEYQKCLELKTDSHVGWLCLKVIESQYKLQTGSNTIELSLKECSQGNIESWNMWMAVYSLVLSLICVRNQDFLSAEELALHACSLAGDDGCFFLFHGAVCMELARQSNDSKLLSHAVRSLKKAQSTSFIPIPLVAVLLAQAEASLGSKTKWEKTLRLEWFSWPPELRPAELFFQMHLLAKESEGSSDSSSRIESCQSPLQWVSRAIHTNPSCSRYWKVLQTLHHDSLLSSSEIYL